MRLSLDLGLGSVVTMGSGAGWSPLDLGSNLVAWWTADDAASMTLVGSAVSAWRDQKGGSELTQALSASRPIFADTGFGGSPGLDFDGVDDCLSAESVFAFPTGASAAELWAVVQQDAAVADATTRIILSYGGAASTVRRGISRFVTGGENRAQVDVGDGSVIGGANNLNVVLSSRHVVRGKVGATASSVDVDQTAAASSTSIVPATGSVRTRIGAISNTSASSFWNGLVRDVIVTKALSSANASELLTYLLARRAL